MMNYRNKSNGRINILAAALALMVDENADAEKLLRMMTCSLCAKGNTPNGGVHVILGVFIPCDATTSPSK